MDLFSTDLGICLSFGISGGRFEPPKPPLRYATGPMLFYTYVPYTLVLYIGGDTWHYTEEVHHAYTTQLLSDTAM
jgi:hypothetical protein